MTRTETSSMAMEGICSNGRTTGIGMGKTGRITGM